MTEKKLRKDFEHVEGRGSTEVREFWIAEIAKNKKRVQAVNLLAGNAGIIGNWRQVGQMCNTENVYRARTIDGEDILGLYVDMKQLEMFAANDLDVKQRIARREAKEQEKMLRENERELRCW